MPKGPRDGKKPFRGHSGQRRQPVGATLPVVETILTLNCLGVFAESSISSHPEGAMHTNCHGFEPETGAGQAVCRPGAVLAVLGQAGAVGKAGVGEDGLEAAQGRAGEVGDVGKVAEDVRGSSGRAFSKNGG